MTIENNAQSGGPLPADARRPTAMIPPGIDAEGRNVFFGFAFEAGERVCIAVPHEGLGQIINMLQSVARDAQHRRVSVDPKASHLEIKQAPNNPVRQIDIDPDISGQFSLWHCTAADGTTTQVQVPLDLMEAIVAHLPSRIAEMKRRQGEHQKQH